MGIIGGKHEAIRHFAQPLRFGDIERGSDATHGIREECGICALLCQRADFFVIEHGADEQLFSVFRVQKRFRCGERALEVVEARGRDELVLHAEYNAVLARIEEHIARDDVFLFNACLFRDERVIIGVFAAEQGQQIDLRV